MRCYSVANVIADFYSMKLILVVCYKHFTPVYGIIIS